jgi:WD40 repeat protein
MLRSRILVVGIVLLAVLAADAGEGQPASQDCHGDPLPRGAVARLGTVRFRHDSTIVFAAFLPDGKRVLSVSDDGVLHVWEFPSGKPIRRLEALTGSNGLVTSATLSPSGKHLTAFCDDGFMRIWDWAEGKQLGKVASVRGAASVRAVSSATSRRFVRTGLLEPTGAGYSPDGNTLMLATRVLQFVDLPTGQEVGPRRRHIEPLISIWFTPDGTQVFTKDATTTHTWNAATGKNLGTNAIRLPPTPGSPTIISPDGRFGLTVARFASPTVARTAKVRDAVLFDTASGKKLLEIGLEVQVTPVHRRPILFSPDSKLLAVNVGDAQEKIDLYAIPSGKRLRTLEAGPAGGPLGKRRKGAAGGAAAPAGGFGGGGGPGGAIGSRFGASAQAMLFSPDGKMLAFQAGPGATIIVLDTATGKKLASLPSPEGRAALHGTFTRDGRCLALEKSDGTVTLYELATGRLRATYGSKLPPSGAAEPDRLADFLSATSLASAKPRVALAISPDTRLLALSGPGGAVHVWDVLTARELTVLKGHTGAVHALAFAPHGKTLASASHDTTALIWDMTRIARPARPARVAACADLETWWQALADDDAANAFAALAALTAVPKDAVAWIKDRVKPVPPLDRRRVQDLLKQLDDGQFKVRDRATTELLRLGEPLLPVLDKVLGGDPSPESRRRVEELRGKLSVVELQGERLRITRAVEVLEFIGTPEARQILQALADGAPGALVTASAQAALKR